MTRVACLLVAALALLAPATAFADNALDYSDSTGNFKSDEAFGNNYIIDVEGNNIRFFDDKDPQGTATYPAAQCSPRGTQGQGFKEILCPKSMFKTIVAEPGSGEDTLQYNVPDIPSVLSGSTGADTITSSDAADDLSGEQGNDSLSSGGGDDFLNGDDGNDKLDGGAGNDKLTGGTGTDTFAAGTGDDTVFAADGLAEQVDCGDGNDTATVDEQDTITGCENVTKRNISAPKEEPVGDDKVKPTLQVGGSSNQKFGKSVRFVATCSEKGLVQAIGFVAAGGINQVFKLREYKVKVGGGGVVIKMPFNKRQRNFIADDLRKKRKPRVKMIISCVDNAGNTSRVRRFWITLRR